VIERNPEASSLYQPKFLTHSTAIAGCARVAELTLVNQPNKERKFIMSGINGDKSRFHRLRKQKFARRVRNRELLKRLAEARNSIAPARSSQPTPASV
jgi:hypothetical protein